MLEKKLSELAEVRVVLEQARSGMSFNTCVALALRRFYTLYRDAIISLVCVSRFVKDLPHNGNVIVVR